MGGTKKQTAANDNDNGGEQISINNSNSDSAFSILADAALNCIYKSDLKRLSGHDGASTGWTSWVEESSAFQLQQAVNRLQLSAPDYYHHESSSLESSSKSTSLESSLSSNRQQEKYDEAQRYTRWLRSVPEPMLIELSQPLRDIINATLTLNNTHTNVNTDTDTKEDATTTQQQHYILQHTKTTKEELLQRIGCRLILLPSGADLDHPLVTPAGGLVYGKLLYGGVTRFRLLRSARANVATRRTGERTAVKSTDQENIQSWLQYGGPERMYEAVHMGPAAVLELTVLMNGLSMPLLFGEEEEDVPHMALANFPWRAEDMFDFFNETKAAAAAAELIGMRISNGTSLDDGGELLLNSNNRMFVDKVGGLDDEIQTIVRRVLDGRVIVPVKHEFGDDDNDNDNDNDKNEETTTASIDASRAIVKVREAEMLAALGLSPVRGLLLHGPPGNGKTLLAREISRSLRARPPKIVAATELLDRWVGGSEKLVRDLFQDAEEELAACGGDPTKSALHVIVMDEIDAVFRRRTSGAGDSGEATRASAVNQILAKLDGITSLGNVLLIGMTNRRELIDDALLRPGRLEVQILIPVPGRDSRRQIMQLHFGALRRQGRLSEPLCKAIDGRDRVEDVEGKRSSIHFMRSIQRRFSSMNGQVDDLAADRYTRGFSGADIAGLVRCAGSRALSRARKDGGGVENLLITLDDVAFALEEVKA